MATGIKKEVTMMTSQRFEEIKSRSRELEKLMDENEKSLHNGLENLKKDLQRHLGWTKA